MHSLRVTTSAIAAVLALGVMPAVTLAGDLSKYRTFELGTDLAKVAELAGSTPSQAKIIHQRPVLIQELAWHPRGATSKPEPAREVVFTFYDGKLFRIAVDYDRYETEGMTAGDFMDAVSAVYGPATKPASPMKLASGAYGDQEEILAQWQDPEYRFDLIRSSYGATFRLVGTLKKLEAPAEAAAAEAHRLDDQEAPQRDAARVAAEDLAAKAKLEKARLANKPRFRP